MRRYIQFVVVAVITVGLCGHAGAMTAEWDEVVDPNLQGYNLYIAAGVCGYAGSPALLQTYGLVNTGTFQEPQIAGTYCYYLTAFNSAGESPASNLVEHTYDAAPPPQCPSRKYCKSLPTRKERRQCRACGAF